MNKKETSKEKKKNVLYIIGIIFMLIIVWLLLIVNVKYVEGAILDNYIGGWKLDNTTLYGSNGQRDNLNISNATLVNGSQMIFVSNSTCKIGQCYLFLGSDTNVNNRIYISNTLQLQKIAETDSVTISLWYRKETTASGYQGIFGRPYTTGWSSPYHDLGIHATSGNTSLYSFVNFDSVNTKFLYTAGQSNYVWHFAVLTYNKSNDLKFYVDGVLQGTISANNQEIHNATSEWDIASYRYSGGVFGGGYEGYIDDINIWSRDLSLNEIQAIYNNSYGVSYPFSTDVVTYPVYNVTLTQSPNDINTSLIGNVNYTGSISVISNSQITNSSSAILYYNMSTILNNGCAKFENQVCTDSVTHTINMSKINNTLFNASVRELYIFPGYYPFSQEFVDNSVIVSQYNNYLNNNIRFIVQNFTTYANPFLSFEYDGNNLSGSSSFQIYYCNKSYVSGNPSSDINCELVQSIIPSGLTNYHMHGTHKHYVLPIAIQTVNKTQNSSFIIYSTSTQANGWNFEYVTNTSYNNQSFQIGNPINWVYTTNIFDIHLHQFVPANDSFNTWIVFNDGTGNTSTSSVKIDYLNAINQPPSTPSIYSPSGSEKIAISDTSNSSIIFRWTNVKDFESDTLYYSLYLTNGLTNYFIFTNLTNSTLVNNSYNYTDTIKSIIPAGVYSTRLIVCDNSSNCVLGSGSILLCANNYVNITGACVSSASLNNVYDSNGCNALLDYPALYNNTYVTCTVPPTIVQNTYSTDVIIFLILGFFIIISTICAIFVNEWFFLLNALLVTLLGLVLLEYNYPQVLLFACMILIILFVGLIFVIRKAKR